MPASAISGDNAMEEHGDDWNDEERGKEPASGSDGDADYVHGPAHNSDGDNENSI